MGAPTQVRWGTSAKRLSSPQLSTPRPPSVWEERALSGPGGGGSTLVEPLVLQARLHGIGE